MQKNICIDNDLHCHTRYSDGQNSIIEMIEAAIDIGLKTIAITDHVSKDTKWFTQYLHDIRTIKDKCRNKINILSGFEAKAENLYGDLDIKDNWYDLVDIVLGAIHSIPSDNGFFLEEKKPKEENILIDCWLKTMAGLMQNKKITIIAHPFLEFEVYDLSKTEDLENIFLSWAISQNKTIEFNLRHPTLNSRLAKKLLNAGISIVIGSDAHSVKELYSYHRQKNRYLDL